MTRRVAILCSQPYLGGMLNTLRNAATLFNEIKGHFGLDQIVVGLKTDAYSRDVVDRLRAGNLEVRNCSYENVDSKFLKRFLGAEIVPADVGRFPYFARPVDGADGYDYLDCEAWLCWSLPNQAPLAPLRPYAAFLADAIPRVCPPPMSESDHESSDPFTGTFWSSYRNHLASYRNARAVFCTTPKTLGDAIAYVGVAKQKMLLLPHVHLATRCRETASLIERPSEPRGAYFVWPTNAAYHKNQPRAIAAIKAYLDRYGGQLDIAVIGPWSDRLLGKSEWYHLEKFNEIYASMPRRHQRRIHFLGELPDDQVIEVFAHSEFVWQNAVYDNGSASAMECGELGVPVVSCDYPQMRHWVQFFGLEARFFDPYRADDAARVLKQAETERSSGTFKGRFEVPKGFHDILRNAYSNLLGRLIDEPAPQLPFAIPAEALGDLS